MKRILLLLLLCTPCFAQNLKVSELTPLTTPDTDDLLYVVDSSAGTGGSKKITAQNFLKSGNNTVLVASSTAPDSVTMSASYVCDGTNDEVQIQQAIDYVDGLGGGTVVLSAGVFNIEMVTSRLTGTGDIADSNTDHFKVDVGSTNYPNISVGDTLIVRGGLKGGTYTMQDYNCDGAYAVDSKSASGLGATEVQCLGVLDGTYVGATYIRPAYGLVLPKQITLRGQGKLITQLKKAASEQGVLLHLQADVLTEGGQQLYNMSINGNSGNQSGNWWEHIGLDTGLSYDVHAYGLEVRYCYGYGLVVGNGWGGRYYGGWIEDCQVGLTVEGRAEFFGLKCQQNGATTSSGAANILLMADHARFIGCELRSYGDASAAVTLRGTQYPIFTACEIDANDSGHTCFESLNYDNAKSPTGLLANSCDFYCGNASSYILDCTYWMLGASIDGSLKGSPTSLINNYENYAHGVNMDIRVGSAYGVSCPDARSHVVPCVNNTGGNAADWTAYVWDEGGSLVDYRLPAASSDVARFAGIHDSYPTADGTADHLTDAGYCHAYTNAASGGADAVTIGELLTLDTTGSYYGYLHKASSGDLAVGIALEALSTGQDHIDVFLIPPRTLP